MKLKHNEQRNVVHTTKIDSCIRKKW